MIDIDVLTQYQYVMDGQTDGQTDGRNSCVNIALSILRYADARWNCDFKLYEFFG